MIGEIFALLYVLFIRIIPRTLVGLLMRVTVCSWKKHDYIWSGGGWIFKSKNNLTCKRCHHGVHKTLDELQKSGPIKMK